MWCWWLMLLCVVDMIDVIVTVVRWFIVDVYFICIILPIVSTVITCRVLLIVRYDDDIVCGIIQKLLIIVFIDIVLLLYDIVCCGAWRNDVDGKLLTLHCIVIVVNILNVQIIRLLRVSAILGVKIIIAYWLRVFVRWLLLLCIAGSVFVIAFKLALMVAFD